MSSHPAEIYMDYAATTPVAPEVREAMEPYWTQEFGNPSSRHRLGQRAARAVEEARAYVAEGIGADPQEIIFTSGATEANNHAIFGVARRFRSKGRHMIVSAIEHPSVLEPVRALRHQEGFEVTYVGVDQEGRVEPKEVAEALTDQTVLVAVMLANNEVGVIQPVAEIARLTRERGVCFLVDAVQAVGHIPVDVRELGVDLLSLSAHKFYGPKGVGALYVRKGVTLKPLLLGGDQEQGRRASTHHVAGIVGMRAALAFCLRHRSDEQNRLRRLRDKLLSGVPRAIEGARVTGSRVHRLPNNAHFVFRGIQAEALLMSLDMEGFAVSMGSACHAGAMEPSHVLKAMGVDEDWLQGALRITLGHWSTEEEVDRLLEVLPRTVETLRF